MISRAAFYIFLLGLFMAGCASAPRDISLPEEKVTDEKLPKQTETKKIPGLQATLIKDGPLRSSPHLLSETIKMIYKFSRVYVLGYEESTSQQGYLKVEHGTDRGYLSVVYVRVDNDLKQFIEDERQSAYKEYRDELRVIESNQRELESDKAWIGSMVAHVRTHYSFSAPVRDYLERGSAVFIQEEKDGWYRILYNGPVIDYDTADPGDISNTVHTYENIADLFSAYGEGWILKDDLVFEETEQLSDDEKRRRIFIDEHPDTHRIIKEAILNGEIIIGMTKDMVSASWGSPDEVNRSTSILTVHEQWIYEDTYLYFENGILRAWQNFDE